MTAQATRRGLRWSSVRDCPRKAVYEAERAPQRDRTREEEGYLWRGKQLGRDFLIVLAAEERRKGNPYRIYVASGVVGDWPRRWVTPHRDKAAFVAEDPIGWELGTGHADGYVVETRTLLEILSSAHASAEMVHSKMLQLVGYMEQRTVARGGAVVVVNPSNPLDYDLHPIARTSRVYAELVDEMRERVDQVKAWAVDGPLPGRVCAKPSDARSHFCRFPEYCFADWEQPDPETVLASDDALAAARDLYYAKQEERARKEAYDKVVSERRQAEQRVEEFLDLAGHTSGKARAGVLEINRIVVADRTTFQREKAVTAGDWTPADDERFAPYLRVGGGHVRYQVDRVSDGPLETFGDEAPWTDADLEGRAA